MSDIEDKIRSQIVAERGIQTVRPVSEINNANHDSAIKPDFEFEPKVARAPVHQGTLQRWKQAGGFLGWIAGILLTIIKVAGPVITVLSQLKYFAVVLKLLLMFGSMFLSIAVYSKLFGWKFGVGLVMLIFIHECGHALAARLRGYKTGIMVFVPLMGAFVTAKGYGESIVQDAFIGIMGPVVGTCASLLCALMFIPTHDAFWLALAQWGCFVNLFNLLPTPPLDGGWITPLFSPKLMAIGVIIAVVVGFKNPLIWLLLLLSIPRIVHGWKADPKTQPYYQVASSEKWKYGLAYLGLASILAISSYALGQAFA